MTTRTFAAAIAGAIFTAIALGSSAHSASIIDEWNSVKPPPAPELKPVTLDPKTTALLLLDFQTPNCTNRPRCIASLPAMKKLLTRRAPRA